MTESNIDIDRIAKEATLQGIDESINRYLAEIEKLSVQFRLLANELYPPAAEAKP